MGVSYDGRGGTKYTGHDAATKVQELRTRAQDNLKVSDTYSNIGYSGHAAGAKAAAIQLQNTANKIERGESVRDYETQGFEGH